MIVELEFWPEYNSGPLWNGGESVDLEALPLSEDLRQRLMQWNARYSDDLLHLESSNVEWFDRGRTLLREVRASLAATHRVVVTEPWWGEHPVE